MTYEVTNVSRQEHDPSLRQVGEWRSLISDIEACLREDKPTYIPEGLELALGYTGEVTAEEQTVLAYLVKVRYLEISDSVAETMKAQSQAWPGVSMHIACGNIQRGGGPKEPITTIGFSSPHPRPNKVIIARTVTDTNELLKSVGSPLRIAEYPVSG